MRVCSAIALSLAVFCCVLLLPPAAFGEQSNFVVAGVPPAGQAWTIADYQQAAAIFSKEKVPLPTLASPEGAALFNRLISEEILKVFLDQSVPLNSRLSNYLAFQDSQNTFLKLYLTAHNEKRMNVPTELVRLMGLLLHLGSVGLSLTNEFIPTIPKDESYEIRMAGVQKMRAGMSKIFSGLEQTLSEKKVYSSADLSELLQAMKRDLPAYKPMFEANFASELAKKLQTHLGNFSGPADRDALQAMISELELKQTARAEG